MKLKKVLIIGASGFVGKYLVTHLTGYNISTISLRNIEPENINFDGVDFVIYLAGIAHQSKKVPDQEYFRVNCDLAVRTAKKAKVKSVKLFVYFSSTKVYGEENNAGTAFVESSDTCPLDAYGKSKLCAETSLRLLSGKKFQTVILRTPLMYGPGVKGNLYTIKKIIEKGIPLPIKGVNNKRSMLFLGNLTGFLEALLKLKKFNQVYLIADKYPVTTEELAVNISKALNLRLHTFHIPKFFSILIKILRPEIYRRVFGDFVIDCTASYKAVSFKPLYSFEEGISKTFSNAGVK